ncbi:unnamed protein product [Closterium sp. NIES-53]
MALLQVLEFDHEGRPVQFDTWLDDLQLYLLSDSKDNVSLFDLASGAATAPPATADSSTRSQWLSRDAAARLAICNHLPLAECAHFGQHRIALALYDAAVARYSSPATAALGRLLLPYLIPELSAFATVEDLVSHLRVSDACYRAAVPAEYLGRIPPPMYITLYFIVIRLPDSLRSVRDHFLSLDPTSLTVDLLEQHLLADETSAVAVGAALDTPRQPFFEGCSPSPLTPSYASTAAEDISVPEDVGAASASAKRRSSKGKGGRGGGGGNDGGGGGSGSGGGGSSGGGGGGGTVGGSGGFGGGGGGSSGSGGTGGGGTGARRVCFVVGQRQQQQRQSETPSTQQLREWFLRGASGGSCPDDVELPRWADLLKSRNTISDLAFDAILSAMYALFVNAEGDSFRCVPPDPGIAAAALGASESGTLPGTAPAEALHTFTLDSGASRCFFRDSITLTPLPTPIPVRLADPLSEWAYLAMAPNSAYFLNTPLGDRSWPVPPLSSCVQRFRPATVRSSPPLVLYELGQVVASCSCRLLSHQTLLWHHPLGHPSLPRLRGMHSCLLVSGLPRSLPPLPPSPALPCLLCVEGRQRAAPLSSSFPPTTAPLQTLYMDVWGPARVSGQSRERYFLLVVDDYTRYTMVFPLRSKGQVVDVLIPWIRTVCLQLRKRFGQDLPVLRLHSDRGVNGIAERRIGLVMEVARTSMIHAAAPHFLWPFAFWYAAHQLNLWPLVSLPETSSTQRWTREVGDASVFRVWGSPVGSSAARGAASGSAASEGAGSEGVEPGGAGSMGAETGGVGTGGSETGGSELEGVEPGGAALEGAESGGAEPQGAASSGATGAGAGGAGVAAGAGVTGDTAASGPGGARTRGTGAAGTGGVEGAGAVDPTESGAAGAGGCGAGAGAVDPGGTVRPRPYFVPLLQQVLGTPSSTTGLTPSLLCPPPNQSQPPLQPTSPLPAPSPYTEQSSGLTERCEPASRPVSTVCTACRAPRSRPPPVPGTHTMALRPSSAPLRVPLPAPPESSLPTVIDPEFDHARAARPTVSRLLATTVTDPYFESAAASALVAELLDFAAACPDDTPALTWPTPLSTSHSLSAPPSDESVEPSGPYPELVGCLMYLMMCTRPDLAYPLSLLARYVAPVPQAWGSCLEDGVQLSSPVTQMPPGSSCEAEIYAGAMAAHELRWLTYLLTDFGEQPRSSPVLYVDNKAMIALCEEHRLEHRTKHIALRRCSRLERSKHVARLLMPPGIKRGDRPKLARLFKTAS